MIEPTGIDAPAKRTVSAFLTYLAAVALPVLARGRRLISVTYH